MSGGIERSSDGRRIGYAQNGEDIVLLRCFEGQVSGVWVDVGANHPVNDSVTKNFSDLGWTGVNIEPVRTFFDELVLQRPADANVLAAVSDETGGLVFHQNLSNLDLSTFDEELSRVYRERGDQLVELEVPIRRLDDICEEHIPGRSIDFLKVDTEGHEAAVLRSHDFKRFPVRVLLAEATPARLPELVDLLASRGMQFVTFDGLNSWFVSDAEGDEFFDRARRPPSPVLDWYHPAVYLRAMQAQEDRILALVAELRAAVAAEVERPQWGQRFRRACGRAVGRARQLRARLRS